MTAPSHRQADVLLTIASFIRANGYPPTRREIGDRVGIRSTNAVELHLHALERKGFLNRAFLHSRGLRLSDAGWTRCGGQAGRRLVDPPGQYLDESYLDANRCVKCGTVTFDQDKPCNECRINVREKFSARLAERRTPPATVDAEIDRLVGGVR